MTAPTTGVRTDKAYWQLTCMMLTHALVTTPRGARRRELDDAHALAAHILRYYARDPLDWRLL